MRLYWIALALIVAGITFLVVADAFTDFDTLRGDQIVTIVAMSALALVLAPAMVGRYAGRGGMLLQHVAIWLGVVAVLALVYRYREMLGLNID